jgi:hypothetical protein
MGMRTHYLPSGRLWIELWWTMKRYFKVSKGHTCTFSASCDSKKATCMKSLKWILFRRMALRIHNFPSGRLKKRLCRSRSDVSRSRKTNRICILCIEKSDLDEVA